MDNTSEPATLVYGWKTFWVVIGAVGISGFVLARWIDSYSTLPPGSERWIPDLWAIAVIAILFNLTYLLCLWVLDFLLPETISYRQRLAACLINPIVAAVSLLGVSKLVPQAPSIFGGGLAWLLALAICVLMAVHRQMPRVALKKEVSG